MRRDDDDEYMIDEAWRAAVRAALKKSHLKQAHLAVKIKCSTRTLSKLLIDAKSSHLVPSIHKALGWPPPVNVGRWTSWLAEHGELGAVVLDEVGQLDRDQLHAMRLMMEQMRKKRGN